MSNINVECGCVQHEPMTDTVRHLFSDATVVVSQQGWRCTRCGGSFFTSGQALAAELAVAKTLVALGSRAPDAFTFCRKAIGIGVADLPKRLGGTKDDLVAYRKRGIIHPDWWKALYHLVMAATGAEDNDTVLPLLPPCRGSLVGQ